MPEPQSARTPQESADQLSASLDKNTAALYRAIEKVRRHSRRTLQYVLVLTLLLGLALKFNHDGIVDRCNSGNALRADIDEKFQQVADSSVSAGFGNTPAEQAILIAIEKDLTPRDCSAINWLGR